MSEHDDTLLDEDLGDEEYDLGNDEEEALLADDYEIERQNSYKGEEETDDVLDLGVTDALDDLDGEDENIEFSRTKTDKNNDNDFYEDGDHSEARSNYYDQDERNEQPRHYEDRNASDSVCSNLNKGDLREKLQKNIQKSYVGNGQGLEDDDCEEARERRNRFQNERTIISPKMNSNIPDTLENVVTSESSRPPFRSWGRGRASSRGVMRGGRFAPQNMGNFNPRFPGVRNQQPFDNQQPICRPPLLEPRPPFFVGVPNNIQNQPILCPPGNPQVPPFQHYPPNGPLQGPGHFAENRGQFGPNQFQGPRQVLGPRSDFGPRPPIGPGSMPHHGQGQGQAPIPGQHGQGPPYSCPPSNQSAYNHGPPGPFQNPSGGPMQDNPPPRFVQGNPGPLIQGNPPGGLLGNPNALPPSGGPGGPGGPGGILQGNQNLPHQGFPRQQGPPISHPNVPMGNQPPYESRPPFQEPHFESRPPFDSRPNYPDQGPLPSQFNNNAPSSQPPPNLPNVPLPPGTKILINPHFRGAVQPSNDARLVWDSNQQSSGGSGGQFSQSLQSFQNQGNYNQSQQGSAPYQQNYQQSKSDDPYMYFSDVWQENKPPKPQSGSPTKPYTERESSYSRDNSYDCGPKYKSDNQWDQKDSYHEEHRGGHQSYRDRELPPKSRNDYTGKGRPLPSSYRDDSYEQSHTQKPPASRSLNMPPRGPPRLPQKRPTDPSGRLLRDLSPKRIKPSNRNLQEVRTVETLHEPTVEKKEEDSDPEMQEYRRKMEEQKRLREQILREKENRRKMAAMEKQNEEGKIESNIEGGQESKSVSVLMGGGKEMAVTNKSHPGVGRGRARPVSGQTTETMERGPGVRIVRTIQSVPSTTDTDSFRGKDASSTENSGQAVQTQNNARRVVIQKPLANPQKIATTLHKTVSNLQKVGLPQRMVTTSGQNPSGGLKKIVTSQRIVTQKSAQESLSKTVINVQEVTNANPQKVVVNTQNNQRVVLQKPGVQLKKLRDVKTNTVKLENLAASTSEAKIRSMCQGIGTIESIQMGERCATIVFKTQSAAMVFHKKYQHKMVDLSLITVRLVPQPSGPKIATNLVKVT